MIFKRFQERAERERQAGTLYECIVRQAREPELYTRYGVPDDLDGRFEMIALHTFLVLNRLKRGNPDAAILAQALYDVFFRDMDDSLRQMGAGDLGVGKKVKRMAEAFSGRIAAYDGGLAAASGDTLEEALRRNLYGTLEHVERDVVSAMARYMRGQCDRLVRQDLEDMVASGEIDFMDPKACP
jgi:cytochrome b pre-mRNA-processing protein 3